MDKLGAAFFNMLERDTVDPMARMDMQMADLIHAQAADLGMEEEGEKEEQPEKKAEAKEEEKEETAAVSPTPPPPSGPPAVEASLVMPGGSSRQSARSATAVVSSSTPQPIAPSAPSPSLSRRTSTHVVIKSRETSGFGMPLSEMVPLEKVLNPPQPSPMSPVQERALSTHSASSATAVGSSPSVPFDPYAPLSNFTTLAELRDELVRAREEVIALRAKLALPGKRPSSVLSSVSTTPDEVTPAASPQQRSVLSFSSWRASASSAARRRDDLEVEWEQELPLTEFSEWTEPFGKHHIVGTLTSDYKAETGHPEAGTSLPAMVDLRLIWDECDRDWLGDFLKATESRVHCQVGLVEAGIKPYFVVLYSEMRRPSEPAMSLVFSPDGRSRFTSANQEALEAWLRTRFGSIPFRPVTSGYWQKSLTKLLHQVELEDRKNKYKIGIIRWLAGQTENEAMANGSSADFEEFCAFLGTKVSLQNFPNYTGGLSLLTGPFSYYTKVDKDHEIMFHVAPFLPRGVKSDVQCLERKRFTGNDVVCVIFLDGEPGEEVTFSPAAVTSQFNHAWLLVRKVSVPGAPTRYRIAVTAKDTFPCPMPFIPSPPVAEKNDLLRRFILCKLINLERAALNHAPVFKSKSRRTRQIYIESAVQRCSAGWEPPINIKDLPPSKIKAGELVEGAKKLKRNAKVK